MDHYKGISPDERWRNDVLNELRELNNNLRKAGMHNDAQVVQGIDDAGEPVRRGKRIQSAASN